ncbi:MAG: hypothetical protein GKR89_23675 [Candidatus Latescibacteria bacterium]|nr:hypothetical protein [Candidatus Latescibacterota bacterium]
MNRLWPGLLVLMLGACAPSLAPHQLKVVEPPTLSRTDTLYFGVYGDNRAKSLADVKPGAKLRQRRQALTKALVGEPFDLLLNTGDLVKNNKSAFWQAFLEDSRPLLRPGFFYPVLGNHEYQAGSPEPYFEAFAAMVEGAKSYAFSLGPAYFLFLDSTSRPHPGLGDNYHAGWVQERLSEAAASPVLVVVQHHPLLSTGRGDLTRWLLSPRAGHAPRRAEKGLRDMLADELARRRRQIPGARTVVFNGHSHFYEYYRYQGVEVYVTGGGGAPQNDPAPGPQDHRLAAYKGDHYLRVRLDSEQVEVELVPVGPGEWIQASP